jgi:hypothetical protein
MEVAMKNNLLLGAIIILGVGGAAALGPMSQKCIEMEAWKDVDPDCGFAIDHDKQNQVNHSMTDEEAQQGYEELINMNRYIKLYRQIHPK